MERLARRCGFQAVSENIPEKDRKLLAHIRKEKQRHERKRQGASEADGVRSPCPRCPEKKRKPPLRLLWRAAATSARASPRASFARSFAHLHVLQAFCNSICLKASACATTINCLAP